MSTLSISSYPKTITEKVAYLNAHPAIKKAIKKAVDDHFKLGIHNTHFSFKEIPSGILLKKPRDNSCYSFNCEQRLPNLIIMSAAKRSIPDLTCDTHKNRISPSLSSQAIIALQPLEKRIQAIHEIGLSILSMIETHDNFFKLPENLRNARLKEPFSPSQLAWIQGASTMLPPQSYQGNLQILGKIFIHVLLLKSPLKQINEILKTSLAKKDIEVIHKKVFTSKFSGKILACLASLAKLDTCKTTCRGIKALNSIL